MSFGKELVQSANEALAMAKGDLEHAAVYIPETVDVAALRKKLKLEKTALEDRRSLPVKTVQDRER